MRSSFFRVFAFVVMSIWLALPAAVAEEAGPAIIDPFVVIEALDAFDGESVWPDFDPSRQPIAIFDGERTLLLRHPAPPQEFTPLADRPDVLAFPGRHPAMRWNSNADIGGARTATLLLTIEPGRASRIEAAFLLHEVFHLFSWPRHPSWRPNEMHRYSYPTGDLVNYELLLLEEELLARALEADTVDEAAGWAASALEARRRRTPRLAAEHLEFEQALEMMEGTAVHVQRLALATPRSTERLRQERPPQGIRWRFYDTGAALAALLDRLDPQWKIKLEAEPEITMQAMLEAALSRRGDRPAVLEPDKLAEISATARRRIAELEQARAAIRGEFAELAFHLVVACPHAGSPMELAHFDPMAVDVLDGLDALHLHGLTLEGPGGRIEVDNPHFVRSYRDQQRNGVLCLTKPAGSAHPFLDGIRRVAIAGFSESPQIDRQGDVVIIQAEGLAASFTGATIETSDEAISITLPAQEDG